MSAAYSPTKVYTTGVFDILHRGHLNILTQAAALGELTVGIMTDHGVEAAKGSRPILTLEERDAQIRSLPFVAEVVHYTETDQTPLYERLNPDIIVQGDDWLHSADRRTALAYFREKRVRLVLLPRTDGISTTEIRKRVERSARRDEELLRDNLRVLTPNELLLFEDFEEAKVQRLVSKIKEEGTFNSPISIVTEGIVIDGVNRLEALKRLGATGVPCVVYNYADIDLIGNVHFVNQGKVTRLSEFARSDGERIEFPRRTPDDIRAAAREERLIPNGQTFHRVPYSVIRFPIPLSALCQKEPFDLGRAVQERIVAGQIRFYQSATYVCDEW